MTAVFPKEHPLLRDIRLSVLGVHREEKHPSAAEFEDQKRRIEHEAYKRGVAAATAACEERVAQVRAELESRHQEEVGLLLERMAQTVSGRVTRHLQELEGELLQLTVESVSKIVGRLPVTVDAIEASLREAIAASMAAPLVRVMLNPIDLELIGGPSGDSTRAYCEKLGLRLEADPSVDRGGCLVETEAGMVDGRRSSRLESFRKAMETA
ncbi:MAG: FliH/SctL family protein [Verrucomicrobiota bacterium]